MGLFATQISTILPALLIIGMNVLKTNNLKPESESMPPSRNEVPETDRWNVEALYQSPENWKQDLEKLEWSELSQYKGRLHDPKAAAKLFDSYLSLQRQLEKLHTYAHLRFDEDLGNDSFKSNFGMISSLIHEFSLETSWIEPEFLSLTEVQFQKLLADSTLNPYRFHLEKIGRMRPHTLSSEQEQLMALSGKALDTSYRAFGALNNADLTFKPAIDSKGEEHPLSNGSYASYLRHPDRALRKSAFENLHRAYEAHANTLCELIQGQVQSHLFVARSRKFKNCLEAALFPHQIDRSVYENLIASVRARLPLLHRYVSLRKKLLKLPDIHLYDLQVPLVEDAEANMDYEEARQAVVASVAPLGNRYQSELKKGLMEDRWVDKYENARKRSGAYSSGCYDSMPYILMNYQGTLNDVLTLAHEAGHSMHSLLSRNHQPYIYSQYPIFVAEVASTFNEQLLLQHLKSKAKSKKDQVFLINYQIEGIRGTILRQTLFAEFELQLHKWAEEGVPLTPSLLKKTYAQLNRDYYGPEMVLDPEMEIEWARIPHFYYNFYVYQYATGLSAALALFQKAAFNEEARDKYLQFLSSGGSKYPIDLLKGAGVDMTKPDAVNAALDHFENLLNEMEKLI
jgi:oligoendopeptidase F